MRHSGDRIKVWGCFSAARPKRLLRVEGEINAGIYREILGKKLMYSAINLQLGRRFVFQKDNDPELQAKATLA